MKGQINLPTLKILSTPIITIGITAMLFIFSIKYFAPKIPAQLDAIKSTQKTVDVLNSRVQTVKTFSSDSKSGKSDITYIVLPDTNPAAVAISQFKRSLSDQGIGPISETNLIVDPQNGEVNYASLSFKFGSDDLGKIIAALEAFQNTAPLVTLSEVNVQNRNGIYGAEVKALTYWSELPKSLPDITQPIVDLSSDEKSLMDKIINFSLPNFAPNTPSAPATDRVNPFN